MVSQLLLRKKLSCLAFTRCCDLLTSNPTLILNKYSCLCPSSVMHQAQPSGICQAVHVVIVTKEVTRLTAPQKVLEPTGTARRWTMFKGGRGCPTQTENECVTGAEAARGKLPTMEPVTPVMARLPEASGKSRTGGIWEQERSWQGRPEPMVPVLKRSQ